MSFYDVASKQVQASVVVVPSGEEPEKDPSVDERVSAAVDGKIAISGAGSPLEAGRFTVDCGVTGAAVDELIRARAGAETIRPDLVEESGVTAPIAYKRFREIDRKTEFKSAMVGHLHAKWVELYGPAKAEVYRVQFEALANEIDRNGAAIFGKLIPEGDFCELIEAYNEILRSAGSKSWIHSYVNLANHPRFLSDKRFNGAFLHPLLIALISHKIGGPIRIVDARGKDAEPISVQAQDNMLHIDNTPFNDEYKVILTWEKDRPSGPKGQNFVFIPGTHKGARNCFLTEEEAWSTENASIFITPEDIEKIFALQKKVLGCDSPMVVEAKHDEKPLTTVFAAGSLVHHRYRTKEGCPRSCMILAFHRAADNPGQFIAPEHLAGVSEGTDLNSFLFGAHGDGTDGLFLGALTAEAEGLALMMDKLASEDDGAELIQQEMRSLSPEELDRWKDVATHAPTVEELKIRKHFIPLGESMTFEQYFGLVNEMMVFDKHGPLDLILYGDSREEIRKWARNQIREMRVDHLDARLKDWTSELKQPAPEDLMPLEQLQALCNRMADIAGGEITAGTTAKLGAHEKIASRDAFRSVQRLALDLGEAIRRCDNRQTFLSTSLFLFWTADTLLRMQPEPNLELKNIGSDFLRNYVTSSILVESQIETERSAARAEEAD
jgi:hypothetical protein